MTYEELVEKIDDEGQFLVQYFDSKPIIHSALRAVVELHKPDQDYPEYCDVCWWEEHERETYPCQTIQAIEKELN